jgi:hypothetical protein
MRGARGLMLIGTEHGWEVVAHFHDGTHSSARSYDVTAVGGTTRDMAGRRTRAMGRSRGGQVDDEDGG